MIFIQKQESGQCKYPRRLFILLPKLRTNEMEAPNMSFPCSLSVCSLEEDDTVNIEKKRVHDYK